MFKALISKLKESAVSVFPVAIIVLLLDCTPLLNLSLLEAVVFACCAIALVLGMALFNLGADIAMTPMGEQIGSGLPKSGKFKTLLLVCFLMGVFVTVAEPDLTVLASQVKGVINGTALTLAIGIGVGLFLVLSVLRVVFRLSLAQLMTVFYLLLFAFASLLLERGNGSFLAIAFDSGGVTTGPITVPFIMALGSGVALTLGDKHDRESSFGFIALCSIGPMLAVIILGLFSTGTIDYKLPDYAMQTGAEIFQTLGHTLKEVLIALLPIVAFFFLLQFLLLKLPKKRLLPIIVGIFYTLFGLVIFLTAVSVGFVPVGYKMGVQLAEKSPWLLIAFAFF